MAHNYSLAEGTVLQSQEFTYTIESVLGQGGFGITYLATAEVMVGNIPQEVRFAIKEHFVSQLCERNSRTLHVEYSEPVSDIVVKSRRDFLREARRLQQLGIKHPNIVRINEVFEANNTAYYVMEYLGDMTLQKYVADNGRLSIYDTEAILNPIIEAVALLHDNHLAHYDIKPGNIMLQTKRGRLERPVLIDFGLAKHYNEDGNATSTLGAGGYSAGYAPLEQIQGIREFSPRCDVYALSAVAYFCLTGERPPEAIKARREVLKPALSAVTDNHTAEAIIRGMAMIDENRTPDARALAKDIFFDVMTDTRPVTVDEDKTIIIPNVQTATNQAPQKHSVTNNPDIVEIDINKQPKKQVPNPHIPISEKGQSLKTMIFIFAVICIIGIPSFFILTNENNPTITSNKAEKIASREQDPIIPTPEPVIPTENHDKYAAAIEYLDNTEKWKKDEMDAIEGLNGLYDKLNTYRFQEVLTTIDELGNEDIIRSDGQIKYLIEQLNKYANAKNLPEIYSTDGSITIKGLFDDLRKRINDKIVKTTHNNGQGGSKYKGHPVAPPKRGNLS